MSATPSEPRRQHDSEPDRAVIRRGRFAPKPAPDVKAAAETREIAFVTDWARVDDPMPAAAGSPPASRH